MFRLGKVSILLIVFLALGFFFTPAANADNFTLQGSFTQDDQVQLFDLVITTQGTVDLRSFGYAGGTTSTGAIVPRGGFDTILTLFDGAGTFIVDNDEGTGVAVDPLTMQAFDARITQTLLPGSYIVALTQYDNFATGVSLAAGFDREGRGNFTADPSFTIGAPCPSGQFRDVSVTAGRCRDGSWTMDFVNVARVTPRGAPIPEPTTMLLLGTGLAGIGAASRRRRQANVKK